MNKIARKINNNDGVQHKRDRIISGKMHVKWIDLSFGSPKNDR